MASDDATEPSGDGSGAGDGAGIQRPGGWQEFAAVVQALGRYLWAQARDRGSPDWPPGWLVAVAIGFAVAVLGCFVVPVLSGLAVGVESAATWLNDQALTRVVTVPVRRYLDTHASAMPVPAETLWWTWCIAGVVLFLLATAGSVGGRVGWVCFGVGTAGIVWADTSAPSQWIGVGVAGLWWSVLSIPAFRRRRPPQVILPSQPTSATSAAPDRVLDAADGLVDIDPRDDAARLAGVFERLTRRQLVRTDFLAPGQSTWTVTATGQGFTAVDAAGRPAAGLARSPEAVTELLAAVSTPPGAPPVIRWTNAPVGTWMPARLPFDDVGGLPALREFLAAGTEQRVELDGALRRLRVDWDVDHLDAQITDRAATLNQVCPLIAAADFVPNGRWWNGEDIGFVRTYRWVDPRTIIGGNAQHWNDFADHRPEIVGLIIRKVLTAEDPAEAVCEVLSDDGIVYLERADGPAGPIHQVSTNGTHRSHALRIIGAPLLAAQVEVSALPLRLHETTMWEPGFNGPAEPLWRGLMRHDLLVGDIVQSRYGAVLEPHYIAAPWLLRPPGAAVTITGAYDRIYPGAFNIPAAALQDRVGWCRWLTG